MAVSLMTVQELSQYLKINERTIYRWVRKGRIPVYRTLGCFRFKQDEIDQWLKDNRGNWKKKNNSEKARKAKNNKDVLEVNCHGSAKDSCY